MSRSSLPIRLAIVCNIDAFLLSHRLPLALEAINRGWEVVVFAADTGRRKEIESRGIKFVPIPFKRSGMNPVYEAKCVRMLINAYRRYRPTIIHHVGVKPIILGCFAARCTGHHRVVNAVSGFGYAFTRSSRKLLRWAINVGLRLVCSRSSYRYIVQNPDDAEQILSLGLAKSEQITRIKGSGVCLQQFAYTPEPSDGVVRILFPARLLYDKGVKEFLEAAKMLRGELEGKALFVLAGQHDVGNPSVLPMATLEASLIPGWIEYVGFCKDMCSELQRSHIVVLPSYREGMPKSLIEAAAIGRPIITTDAIGCRECVDDGVNGYLVPVRSVKPLAEAIYNLVMSAELRQSFGLASRHKAESEFGIEYVVERTFEVYDACSVKAHK